MAVRAGCRAAMLRDAVMLDGMVTLGDHVHTRNRIQLPMLTMVLNRSPCCGRGVARVRRIHSILNRNYMSTIYLCHYVGLIVSVLLYNCMDVSSHAYLQG
jgi:hypothetical protein